MASIFSLPVELKQTIFSYETKASSGVKLRATLCKVCRHFRDVVQPLLYNDIYMLNPRIEKLKEPGPPLHLLLRTLLTRNDLAAAVYRICLRGWSRHKLPRKAILRTFTVDELDLLRNVLDEAAKVDPGGGAHRWDRVLESGELEILVGLTIAKCKNLHTLDMDAYSRARPSRLAKAFSLIYEPDSEKPARVLTPRPPIRKVEFRPQFYAKRGEVPTYVIFSEMMPSDINDFFSIWNLLPLLRIPTIQEIRVDSVSGGNQDRLVSRNHPAIASIGAVSIASRLPANLPVRTEALTTLVFTHVRLAEESLVPLLALCKSVRHLVWERAYDSYERFSRAQVIDCGSLHQALSEVRATLETLRLGFSFRTRSRAFLLGTLASLRDFPRLEALRVPWASFLGTHLRRAGVDVAEMLPRNLRSLVLTDDAETHDEWKASTWPMQQLLLVPRGDLLLPRLHSVTLSVAWKRWLEHARSAGLEDACAAAGMQCTLECPLEYDDEYYSPRLRRWVRSRLCLDGEIIY